VHIARRSGEEIDMKAEHSKRPTIQDLSMRANGAIHAQRGSALLIVIGTLALISVFAAVYISIGRTDRRAANAVKVRNDQQDTSFTFGEYFVSTIGADRLDSYTQWDGLSATPFGRREVTDAPYTDWTRRSEVVPGTESSLFSPIGGMYSLNGLSQANDRSVASDPWLASTTPVYLGTPGLQNVLRPFSNVSAFDPDYPNATNYLDNRDWLQISNFAPDGRFVNLFNLRPNKFGAGQAVGRFDAEPGTGTITQADGRQVRRMSEFLSLWDQEIPGDPESMIQAFDPVADGIWVSGQNAPLVGVLSPADIINTPAVWTMYQRFMFMPMNQPFATLNRNGDISSWADPDFPAYQYADADGDGMADSRWFELSAARDRNEGSGTSPREDVEVLYNNKDYRYFLAARAVDLSSMVNVNTATDLLTPPTSDYPLGLTPADVDLRRLLTMQDAGSDFIQANSTKPLSYQSLHRPYIQRQSSPREPLYGSPDPYTNFLRNVSDYWYYEHGSLGSDLRTPANNTASMLIGRYAYDALRRGITKGGSLTDEYKGVESPSTPTVTDLAQFEVDPETFTRQITPKQRADQYLNVASLDPTNLGASWGRNLDYKTRAVDVANNYFGSGLYGMDDLAELLTFHGLNDPDSTSRLERVSSGRYEGPSFDENQFRRLGPLMSNRPLALDRNQHGIALVDIGSNPNEPPNVDSWDLREVNGRVSINSMAHFALTPRNKLTTISGGVSLVPTSLISDPITPTSLDLSSAAPTMRTVLTNPSELFGVYSNALAGELDSNSNIWSNAVDQFRDNVESSLFYGYRGPELALRISAHASVNMKDITDADTDPTVATLIVGNGLGAPLRTYLQNTPLDPSDDEYQLYPGIADGNVFDPGETELLNSSLPDRRQVVNVFGFEAMPVLTEVSVLYAFTDSSDDAGGDMDYNLDDEALFIPGGEYDHPPTVKEVTINGELSSANNDFLMEVLAFQLHNPYDHAISLGGDGLSPNDPLTRHRVFDDDDVIDQNANYQFDYYIEYAGRFYKIAKYLEWYPTDRNSESYFTQDDPLNETAYGTVPNNPMVDAGSPETFNGIRMEPGSDGPNATPGTYSNQAFYSDFITRNVVLAPGQTRVFYVIADKRFDGTTPASNDESNPDDRWTRNLEAWNDLPNKFTSLDVATNDRDEDNLPDGPGDSRGWTGPAEQWVEHQLTVASGDMAASGFTRPVMMMEFDPRDGKLINESATGVLEDPVDVPASRLFTNRNDASEVRLWKKIVTNNEESNDTSSSDPRTIRNLVENDMLVDRMDVDFSSTHTLSAGDTPIEHTVSYDEGYPEPGTIAFARNVRNDNTGITVAQWATYRRADSQTMDEPDQGEITPWMLRSLGNPSVTRTSHDGDIIVSDLTTTQLFDGTDVTDTSEDLTILGDFEIQETMIDFWDLSRVREANAIVQTLALAPNLKSDPVGATPDPGDGENRTSEKFMSNVLSLSGTALDTGAKAAPLIFVGGDHIADAPRLGDLLLSWGIGTSYAPDVSRSANSTFYEHDEWMTAPEAMAIAMGIDSDPDAGVAGTDIEAVSIWKDAYDVAANDLLLDDGRLAIDNYVSFLNVNTEAPGDPAEFDIGLDLPRGSGVPMALGVIDHVRAIEPIEQITDPEPTGATQAELLQLALTRSTFGSININTAPVEVLRLLPGLSPSRAQFNTGGASPNEWWGKDYVDTKLPDLNLSDLTKNPDVAAAIVAYRDRLYGVPNTSSRPEKYTSADYDDLPLNLGPTDPFLMANNMLEEFPLVVDPADNTSVDRTTITGIDALRQSPGFASLGELLAVTIDPRLSRTGALDHLSIQQYGNDGEGSGVANGPDGEITIMSQLFGGNESGETIDDYAERISMANGVLNTLSVRSDYFAVWFVVHGYRESDVANLRPEDPLIPSVKKRFLMVVDRSNVIEPSDKPKILVFKEIPL
jgi:hypothetical protein